MGYIANFDDFQEIPMSISIQREKDFYGYVLHLDESRLNDLVIDTIEKKIITWVINLSNLTNFRYGFCDYDSEIEYSPKKQPKINKSYSVIFWPEEGQTKVIKNSWKIDGLTEREIGLGENLFDKDDIKMDKYNLIVYKALFFELFMMKKKAIHSILSNLYKLDNKREISSLLINVGMIYNKLGEKNVASEYFIKGLHLVENEKLEYHPDFPKILRIISENSTLEVSEYWKRNFRQRINDDKKFSKCFKM